jgi:2,4-dienoyl-CoA reductase-like NADH-dependent reductase (Old Yellow Enzyme family)/thioredoxin reductase
MPSPFEPIRIGSLELPNRLAMAPMKTAFGTTSGEVTERLLAYFRRRAEGGVGLIISEPLYVDKRGREHPKQLGIDADDKLEGLGRLADAVHRAGARIFAHLNHGGRAAMPMVAGQAPEAPSKCTCPSTGIEPEVLEGGRIAEIINAFARAALRAKEVGFDGVEIQFGLGYLVSQFLSPATNLRTDGYGGDAEGRMRFGAEVYSSVRQAVGESFPIGVRISGSEKVAGGLDIEDAKSLVRRLESWGADLIHVATGSSCDSPPWYFQHMALSPGTNESLAGQVRNEVAIPVMAAGRLGDPPRIRDILGAEMVDMVALGRPLLADPDLPRKMIEGRDEEVLLCGQCLQGCLANVKSGKGIGCNINPTVGYEIEEIGAAARAKRVVVVGGGPAGLSAALAAHGRGHRVTLFEKNRLGGQFALAFLPPAKQRMEKPLRSLIAQLERSGVEIRLGEEATRDELQTLRPDVVIVATGSRPAIPDIPGLDQPVTAEEVLTEARETGNRVLVLGGGMVGVETAEFLAKRGKQIAVVEMLDEMAEDMDPVSRKLLFNRLASLPVELHRKTRLVRVENGRALVDQGGQQRDLGPFDSVVVATGNRPFDPLSEECLRKGIAVKVVGDAKKPGKAYDAVRSGHVAGMAV